MIHFQEIRKIRLLKNYSKEIYDSYDVNSFNENDYYILCFFDDIPSMIIDTALHKGRINLIFRAKYENGTERQKLLDRIEKYFFDNRQDEISDLEGMSYRYISFLFLLNNDKKAKKILYKILKSTKYTTKNLYDGRQNYKISLSYIAINYYLAFYPPNHSISTINPIQFEIEEGKPILSEKDINKAKFEHYKKDIEKYISEREKDKIIINTKFFNLGEYVIEKYFF
jgi:hypothetical protein